MSTTRKSRNLINFILIFQSFIFLSHSCRPDRMTPPSSRNGDGIPVYEECDSRSSCIPARECEISQEDDGVGHYDGYCGQSNGQLKVCCVDDKFPRDCGFTLARTRIIGGNETTLGEFPWLVALIYSKRNEPNKNFNLRCAGSLINARYVLTAAHCLHRVDLGNLVLREIRIGDHNLTSLNDCVKDENGQIIYCNPPYLSVGADDMVLHPEYDPISHINDIAVIRLDQTVNMIEMRGMIAPVCIPLAYENPEIEARSSSRSPMAVGWGIMYSTKDASDIPLKVSLPFYDKDMCAYIHQKEFVKGQICLGGQARMDTCMGDSGGPLMLVGDSSSPFLQIGIISYGTMPCGSRNKPGVYTKVSHYVDWMRDAMKPWPRI